MVSDAVAIIGAGHWGRNHVRNFAKLGALRTICDFSAQVLDQFAPDYPDVMRTGDLASVLADPAIRGVVIATPAETHGDIAARAMAAGKDVLIEKPICLDLDQANALADQAKSAGRILMVGHLLHYHPAFQAMLKTLQSGRLGQLRYVYSQRLALGKIRSEENALWSFAPHDIAMILALTGTMPDRVASHGGAYVNPQIADTTLSYFYFPSGVQAHIHVSWLHPYKDQRLVVVGSEAMAVFNDVAPGTEKLQLFAHRVSWDGELSSIERGTAVPIEYDMAQEPLAQECRHFLDCMRTRTPPVSDAQEAIRVLRVLTACQSSLEGGGMQVP